LHSFRESDQKILFVRGVINEDNFSSNNPNITVYNYLYGERLEEALNSSRLIISRSGYTTLMDLAKLEKKAFFIPTPGQFEQEYLAARMTKLGIAASCSQEDFTPSLLKNSEDFYGLSDPGFTCSFSGLFSLFEGK
ncbi:MAG TPA: glycosyltransferase, partial [Salinimicrobium catena]|nr:glycosyltransferase [Salinimicrobium catena]